MPGGADGRGGMALRGLLGLVVAPRRGRLHPAGIALSFVRRCRILGLDAAGLRKAKRWRQQDSAETNGA